MRSPRTFRHHSRKFIFGWVGGILLFLASLGTGVFIASVSPEDNDYNLSIGFVSLRKLQFLASLESNTSSLQLDDVELNAKMESNKQSLAVKVSPLQEPFSDIPNNLLSLFVISEDDSYPYLLLSPTNHSKVYIEWTSTLLRSLGRDALVPILIRLKTNGNDSRAYYKLELPAIDDLESLSLQDVLNDDDFKSQFPVFTKALLSTAIEDKSKWLSETLLYFRKDSNGLIKISHFLPTTIREAYE